MPVSGSNAKDRHLDVEQIERAADGLEAPDAGVAAHLELCAVCRAEVERAVQVRGFVADLGVACREEAPPEWPAMSAIEARAKEAADQGFFARIVEALGTRGLRIAVGGTVALVAIAVAAVALLSRGVADRAPGADRVALPAPDAVPAPAPVVPHETGPEGGVATGPTVGPEVSPPSPAPLLPSRRASSVVAVAAGHDVDYVLMDVPYEGATVAVIWLSRIPKDRATSSDAPM